jgi:predicted DNA-binding transcriptional regulator AlpA
MSKTSEQRLIGEEELRKKGIKYSRSQRARLTRVGKFPKPVKGVAKANAWVESEIDALIAARIAGRDQSTDAV